MNQLFLYLSNYRWKVLFLLLGMIILFQFLGSTNLDLHSISYPHKFGKEWVILDMRTNQLGALLVVEKKNQYRLMISGKSIIGMFFQLKYDSFQGGLDWTKKNRLFSLHFPCNRWFIMQNLMPGKYSKCTEECFANLQKV